ncbi:enoyl-CoA hydratase/isomerase family protein [Kineobactrum salinum]|uniref:Enoyl-CoA hydratase/isomerase family protein n=1 Tax=Kineobactrum salinum TaxID=2708301 RepID=A0A6C0U396_9GAMM|nr:enoyl-CoA hydratase/isomerase family protein [Kineobactrum salinum]QIB65447.1 enoyl-CoA hydratase/isomerase family protein [Kineobactrum salinum]
MINSGTRGDTILYSEYENVGIVTFNRPETLNTFRTQEYTSLSSILYDVHSSPHLRALIITGKGPAFSAGQDLTELDGKAVNDPSDQLKRLEQLQNLTQLIDSLSIPSIVAFNGLSVGFGLEISLACDFRIAATESYFMFPEVTRGLLHTNGTLWFLPRLIGLTAAKEMLLQGGKFDANYALEKGLVSAVYSKDELFEKTLSLALKLSRNSLNSIALIKTILSQTYDVSLEQMLKLEADNFLAIVQSADFKEGVSSFLEKRNPAFS